MPLASSSKDFHPPVDLSTWKTAMLSDSRWKLILRNFEREYDRDDIDRGVWEQFLRDIEGEWNAHSVRTGPANPVKVMDEILKRDWKVFTPPGKPLSESPESRLYRYTRLDWFWRRNLKHLPISGQSNQLAQEISSGRTSGVDILGYVGSVDRPGWCTNATSGGVSTDANRIRDQIGLKHIEGDWLLEIAFPFSFLQSQNIDLQAPTVIDSVAGGAENWIFSKRQGTGGPDWGVTVDMKNGGKCAPGVAEAVHQQFNGAPQPALSIQLRVVGEITTSAPSVDYAALLSNPLI